MRLCRKPFKLWIFIGLMAFVTNATGQSFLMDKTITISIVNKRFDIAIKLIQEEVKINFSYNSDIIPKNKIVTIKANQNRLDKVLTSLLSSVDLQLKEVNNQIIITKSETAHPLPKPNNQTQVAGSNRQKTEISGKVITIIDTIVHSVHDTVVKTVYDTIRITVYDTRVIRQINKLSVFFWSPKFSVSLSGSMMYQLFSNPLISTKTQYPLFFTQYSSLEKNRQGYTVASTFAVKQKRVELAVGIEYFKAFNNIHINDLPEKLAKIDSTIISTTIKPQGIFYTYKVDTVQLSVYYNPNEANIRQAYSYYGFPVSLSYKIIDRKKFAMGINLGLVYSVLIKASGIDASLNNGETFLKNREGEAFSRTTISWTTGIDMDYPLNDRISITSSLRIRKNFTSIYNKSFQMEEKPFYIYPSLSIKYKL